MKHNLKIFCIALLMGMAVAFLYTYKFNDTINSWALGTEATIFYVGSYNNLEEATNKKNNYKEAIIYNDKGIYKVVIGVFTNKDSVELMRSYFNDLGINFNTYKMKVSGEFKNLSDSYELLIKSSSKDMYANINKSLLKLFSEYKN